LWLFRESCGVVSAWRYPPVHPNKEDRGHARHRAVLGAAGVDRPVDGSWGGVKGQRVVVRVEAGPGPYPCPACATLAARYDSKRRRWRYLDTMQFTTWIEADVPRVECPTHGVKQVRVPRAEPGSQFTALFVNGHPNSPTWGQ
jgi:hypothetical protein